MPSQSTDVAKRGANVTRGESKDLTHVSGRRQRAPVEPDHGVGRGHAKADIRAERSVCWAIPAALQSHMDRRAAMEPCTRSSRQEHWVRQSVRGEAPLEGRGA